MELTQNVKNIQEKWDKNFMQTYAQIPVVIDKGQGATAVSYTHLDVYKRQG